MRVSVVDRCVDVPVRPCSARSTAAAIRAAPIGNGYRHNHFALTFALAVAGSSAVHLCLLHYVSCICLSVCFSFLGCSCRSGSCRTTHCPCWSANRECDPDLCRSCEAHVSNDELKQSGRERACKNVSIQTGERKQLLLAPSAVHGWGAFVTEEVRRGEFITEYFGELISQDEADRRGKIYDKLNRSYLFNLNEVSNLAYRLLPAGLCHSHSRFISITFCLHLLTL